MNRIPRADFLEAFFRQLSDFEAEMCSFAILAKDNLTGDAFFGFLLIGRKKKGFEDF